MIEYTEEATAELDQSAPHFLKAYINYARDKITVYFGEELDKDSIPSVSDFSLSDGTQVSTVNILDNEWYSDGKVELYLSSAVDDITNLEISYNGTALRDKATVPNQVSNIAAREVEAAGLTVENVYVSNDGQYIAMNIDKSMLMEKGKSFDIILKYGADSATATPLDSNWYSKTWSVAHNGDHMDVYLKLNDVPELFDGSKYYITLSANGLKDFAGDAITDINAQAIPNATAETGVMPTSAVYSSSAKNLTLTFDANSGLESSTVYGCFFELVVGGKAYMLRGMSYLSEHEGTISVRFTQENMPFDMTAIDWTDAKVSYSLNVHPQSSVHYHLVFNTGMPYEGFDDIGVTTGS